MGKDPAFLFYHHDFLIGTAFLTFEERGVYITILAHMATLGGILTYKQVMAICGNFNPKELLENKFKIDEGGNYYNPRLSEEIIKRKKFTKTRLDNLNSKKPKPTLEVVIPMPRKDPDPDCPHCHGDKQGIFAQGSSKYFPCKCTELKDKDEHL